MATEERPEAPRELPFGPAAFAASYTMLASGVLRMAARTLELYTERAAALAQLTLGSMSGSESSPTAQAVLRDEILGLMREFAEIASQETRSSIAEFDEWTRSWFAAAGFDPQRLHRVKE